MPFVNILSRVNSPPFAIFSLFYCFFALFPLFTVFSVILNVCSRGHSEPPCGVKNPLLRSPTASTTKGISSPRKGRGVRDDG